MKRFTGLISMVFLLFSVTGCVALLAGAGGTALWQMGKIISEEQVSIDRAAKAVETAFKDKQISLEDKIVRDEVIQLRGKDKNGTKVAVDIFSKGSNNSKIEIRYGIGEETSARELLNQIKKRL